MKPCQIDPEKSLLNLCELAGISITRGWKTALAGWLGVERVILSNWLRRGLPRHIIETVSHKGVKPSDWLSPGSAPQSTISARPLASYEQDPERMTAPGRSLLESEGLHAQTQCIEVGGQKIAVSTFSPDPGWIHRAVDEIMAGNDPNMVIALESTIRVFADKLRKDQRSEV